MEFDEKYVRDRFADPTYRAEQERLARSEAIARMVIERRGALNLTQQQLAERIGTTASVISRIESGLHSTSVDTLQRLFEGLESRMVVGYETGPIDAPTGSEAVAVGGPDAGVAVREVVVAGSSASTSRAH
jgi:ribosome-binding protein aMBF1 (putative translation factor)